jgi:tetrahydromethanopterin S-methyltransferase subunit G
MSDDAYLKRTRDAWREPHAAQPPPPPLPPTPASAPVAVTREQIEAVTRVPYAPPPIQSKRSPWSTGLWYGLVVGILAWGFFLLVFSLARGAPDAGPTLAWTAALLAGALNLSAWWAVSVRDEQNVPRGRGYVRGLLVGSIVAIILTVVLFFILGLVELQQTRNAPPPRAPPWPERK